MERMTVKDLVKACGGTLLYGREEKEVTRITINSRDVKEGDLFVPLIGERVDAHKFLIQALKDGAQAALTSKEISSFPFLESGEKALIQVRNTKKALQDIGKFYRNRLSLPLIGITGSVGKTTTREMIAAALSAERIVYQTKENHNSQVGVPITLTEISEHDQIGVIELGMSEPGELTMIAQIAQVDMAVITNIGVAHIEQLGSKENICMEKLTIQDGLKTGGTLFLNGEDEYLRDKKAKEGCKTIYYGFGQHCQYRAVDISTQNGYSSFIAVCGDKRVCVKLKVPGKHQVLNAIVALGVADQMGVSVEAAARKLEEFTGVKGRMQIFDLETIKLIDDTYNASPVSMRGALDTLDSIKSASRRIAVLADMKELGPQAVTFHQQIGEYLGGKQVEILVTYGELAKEIGIAAVNTNSKLKVTSFSEGSEKEAMEQWLEKELKPGDCILLKGSNSMKLGEVAAYVRQHHH